MKKWLAMSLALMMAISFTVSLAESEETVSITPYAYYAAETLPKIYIYTEEGMALDDPSLVIPDEHKGMNGDITVYDYVNATVTVTDCEGYELENAVGMVKIRGNYTSTYPKRPIRIKFNESQAMCGLNGGNAIKNWVLLAEYKDPSLLRNSVAFYISNSLYSTTGNYATDFRNVEVYLNGEYNGLYVLAEQQQVNEYRVNLPQPENPAKYEEDTLTEEETAALKDVHTGYFIEYDGYYTNEKPEVTFTIRYDWVTRPNGETFLPSSAGNDADQMTGENAAEAADNSDNDASWGGQADRTEQGDGNGASWGEQADGADQGDGNGASWGGQADGTEQGNGNGASWGEQADGADQGDGNGASWGGQADGTEQNDGNGTSWGGQTDETDQGDGNGTSWGGQADGAEQGDGNGTSWGGQTGETEQGDGNGASWGGGFGWGNGGQGTTRTTGFTINSDIYYEEQKNFIQHTIQTVWDVIYDAVYTDHSDMEANPYHTMDSDGNYIAAPAITTAYDAVASVVDIDSLIDMYIIQEIAMDSDLDWSSFYFSIDMSPEGNHLLTYTAPWDFDSGFNTGSDTTSLYAVNYDNPWLVIFCNQDWFWQKLNARWDEAMEAGVFSGVLEMLDTLSQVNEADYERNLERWPQSGTEGNMGASFGGRTETQAEAAESLRTWLEIKIRNTDRLIDEMAGDTGFAYVHDPRENAEAMKDIIENPDAVYGFSPDPQSQRLGSYADYDWTDPTFVAQAQEDRRAYHESMDSMTDILYRMREEGASIEEMARAVSEERNRLRLESYKDDPEGLAAVKESNLKTYGHEDGPTPDELYEKYGSWIAVMQKAFSANMGMDACCGLYDEYYWLYIELGYVEE